MLVGGADWVAMGSSEAQGVRSELSLHGRLAANPA